MCRDTGRNNYFVWTRWGRVGEPGATKELGPYGDEGAAAKEFAKKFRDKTGNKWEVRAVVLGGVGVGVDVGVVACYLWALFVLLWGQNCAFFV